jgi:hypothetical protein
MVHSLCGQAPAFRRRVRQWRVGNFLAGTEKFRSCKRALGPANEHLGGGRYCRPGQRAGLIAYRGIRRLRDRMHVRGNPVPRIWTCLSSPGLPSCARVTPRRQKRQSQRNWISEQCREASLSCAISHFQGGSATGLSASGGRADADGQAKIGTDCPNSQLFRIRFSGLFPSPSLPRKWARGRGACRPCFSDALTPAFVLSRRRGAIRWRPLSRPLPIRR